MILSTTTTVTCTEERSSTVPTVSADLTSISSQSVSLPADAHSSPSLPYELLIEVAKYALSPVWPSRLFFPLPTDPRAVRGFALASRACWHIVELLSKEVLFVKDLKSLENVKYPGSVRHLRIEGGSKLPAYEDLNRIFDLTQLVSLSIPELGYISGTAEPSPDSSTLYLPDSSYSYFSSSSGYPSSSASSSSSNLYSYAESYSPAPRSKIFFPPSLKRLEIRDAAPRAPSICKVIVKAMPDLYDLRLGNWALEDTVDNPFLFHYNLIGFEASLAASLSPMSNLRVLSLDICLESFDHLGNIRVRHYSNIEHTQATEGYERHYSDCPFCEVVYKRNLALERENEVTLLLAKKLTNLESVTWVHGWCRDWRNGHGRRVIAIKRNELGGNGTVGLLRLEEST